MKNDKGIVLFIVLATILVIIILANIVLGVVSSQSRLTHHQISRIQAFYAAQAGVNYAREMIRLNNTAWVPQNAGDPALTGRLCNTAAGGCATAAANDITDNNLPHTIRSVSITIGAPGSGISGTREIRATVDYAPAT
jgi:Tfp pilus assembly protein PilX